MSTDPPPKTVVFVERSGNGLAVAALVLGILGAIFALIPLTFFIAWILGVLAISLGIPAIRAAKIRGRRAMAWIGTILGVIALGLGILGVAIINNALDDLSIAAPAAIPERVQRDLDRQLAPPEWPPRRAGDAFL